MATVAAFAAFAGAEPEGDPASRLRRAASWEATVGAMAQARHDHALALADDLKSFTGSAIALDTQGVTFADRVTRARHVNGSLIIDCVDRYAGQPTREYVAVYDAANGFALLGRTQTADREVMDNHNSFEVIGDRLYLFQQQTGAKIAGKMYRLQP